MINCGIGLGLKESLSLEVLATEIACMGLRFKGVSSLLKLLVWV